MCFKCKGEGHTEEVIEEFTDVFVGLESVVDGRLEFGIYVSEVELLVSALLFAGPRSLPLGKGSRILDL